MQNKIFWAAALLASAIGFLLSAYDKRAAIKGKRRVPERTLFLIAGLFGAFGMYLSMLLFRHKTRHKRFMVTLPILIALQAAFILRVILRAV